MHVQIWKTLLPMKSNAPHPIPRSAQHRLFVPIEILALWATLPALLGCKTFNSTETDLDRERQQIGDGHVAWYGFRSPLGPMNIGYLDPNYESTSGSRSYQPPCWSRTR
jgi:hypothetical protein